MTGKPGQYIIVAAGLSFFFSLQSHESGRLQPQPLFQLGAGVGLFLSWHRFRRF
jgi:hypothetical protein